MFHILSQFISRNGFGLNNCQTLFYSQGIVFIDGIYFSGPFSVESRLHPQPNDGW